VLVIVCLDYLSPYISDFTHFTLHSQQKSYLSTVEYTYRNLADLLLKQDRILEAQQVLDLLKVQELSDYLKTVRGNSQTAKGVDLQPPEQNIFALGNELAELQKIKYDNLTQTQKTRLAYLTNQESDRNRQFNEFLKHPEVQKQIEELRRVEKQQNVNIETYNQLRKKLAQVKNAALFYPLILDDRLELILITASTPPIRKTTNLKRKTLNQDISSFIANLRDPSSLDVKNDGQKFYNYLIKPFEKELQTAKIETIIYTPDGQLRYIPLAALYDGRQWLIERYRINNITASSLTDFAPRTYNQPRILAAAATQSQNIKLGDRPDNLISFGALPATKIEVEAISKLIPETTVLIDGKFNQNETLPRMQSHNIVHLATHGYFAVGDAQKSFILYGDGKTASMTDIAGWTLTNVNLVVLSACETAIGGKVGNGIEILGLGYQIQTAGAGAAIASLWKVSDDGTQSLMQKLYESLKQQDMSASEALRQAQIAMIHSDKQGTSGDRASVRVVGTVPNATSGQFSHPFYWSAFILIGNGL
jgi:CHAT domain-containing protein